MESSGTLASLTAQEGRPRSPTRAPPFGKSTAGQSASSLSPLSRVPALGLAGLHSLGRGLGGALELINRSP